MMKSKKKLLLMMKPHPSETTEEFSERVINSLKERGILDKDGNSNLRNYYTAKEIAQKLGLNIMTIYRYIKAGKLRAYKFGKEFRIDSIEFDKFLNKARTK